jgi:hypothetical protein
LIDRSPFVIMGNTCRSEFLMKTKKMDEPPVVREPDED